MDMNVKKSTAIASAMTGLLALGAQFIAAPVMAADDKEKCYGDGCPGGCLRGGAQGPVREARWRVAATQV